MVADAKALKVPLMAGSSLPVTWRLPAPGSAAGSGVDGRHDRLAGEIEIFGFHALESLQCMVERRDRKGKPQGVAAHDLPGGRGRLGGGRPGSLVLGIAQRRLEPEPHLEPRRRPPEHPRLHPPAGPTDLPAHPIAFLVEYADGLKAGVLILNGHIDDTSIARPARRRLGRLDPLPPARPAGGELFHAAGPPHRGLLPDGSPPLPRRADPADRRHPRRRPGKPRPRPPTDRDARPRRDRLRGPGRLRLHPRPDRQRAEEPGLIRNRKLRSRLRTPSPDARETSGGRSKDASRTRSGLADTMNQAIRKFMQNSDFWNEITYCEVRSVIGDAVARRVASSVNRIAREPGLDPSA